MKTTVLFSPMIASRALRSLLWTAGVLLFLLSTAVGLSCGVAPGDRAPTNPDESAISASPEQAALETVRIQKYLDSQYLRTDVRHSFRTIFAEDIDCVDFDAYPSVRALRARGQVVTPEPSHRVTMGSPSSLPGEISLSDDVSDLPAPAFNGAPDENGNARRCPGTTVPFVRSSVEDIKRVGGLDAFFLRGSRESAPRPVAPNAADSAGYMHAVAEFNNTAPNAGGASLMSIYAPGNVQLPNWHSVSQIWAFSGSKFFNDSGGCTVGSTCVQSVEAGWTVDPALNKSGGGDNLHAYLFTFTTNDGYFTNCYNESLCVNQNKIISNNPFVPTTGAPYAPGMILSSGVAFGPVNELTVWTVNPATTATNSAFPNKDWYVVAGVSYQNSGQAYVIGSYPGYYSGSMQTSATNFEAGGEVYSGSSAPVNLGMGSGFAPGQAGGFGSVAYHRNVGYWTSAGFNSASPTWFTTNSACYSISNSVPAGFANWGFYFYFGGIGRVCYSGLGVCNACQ